MRTDGFWEPENNNDATTLCTICAFSQAPVMYIKGTCAESRINWVYYPIHADQNIVYEGYRRHDLKYDNCSNSWTFTDRTKARIFTNRTRKEFYPIFDIADGLISTLYILLCPSI